MNQKYMINENGIVTVVTNDGTIIERKEPYTESTTTILSLENLAESIESKINYLEKRISDLNNSIRHKIKIIRYANILLTLSTFVLLILGVAFVSKLFLILILSSIPIAIIIKKIENIIIEKDKTQRNSYNKRIQEEVSRLNKINRRINSLPKEKIAIVETKINVYNEVKSLDNNNIDASDYFVENYLINKRTEEMSKNMPKVKKKIKTINNTEYDF